MITEPIVPISAIEHHAYCPRQCALIHVDGLWKENAHTVRGERGHRRVDTAPSRTERGRRVLRGVPLWSEALGLSGRGDAIEVFADGRIVPVEYKIGDRHEDAAHLQVCGQALCLEEMLGRPISEGAVWFASPRRRVRVLLDGELRARTLAVIEEIRSWLRTEILPPPVDDGRCRECQLIDMCQPSLCAHPERVISYLRNVVGCEF